MNKHEKNFLSLFENSMHGITITDENFAFSDVNPAMCLFLEYTKEELLEKKMSDVTHPDDVKESIRLYKLMKKGELNQFEIEKRYLKKNGSVLFANIAVKAFYDSKGVFQQAMATIQDITTRKLNELRLKESEEKFRLLSETARDLICLLDETGRYTYLSPSVKDVLGFESKELIGKSPYLLFHPSDVTRIMKESQEKEQESGFRYTLEYRMKKKNGKYIWLQTVTEPIKDKKGNIVQIQTSSRDITKMKDSEEKIKDLLSETQRLNENLESKSEMLKTALEDSIQLNQDLENREKLQNFLISIGVALSGMRDTDDVISFILTELHPVVHFDGVGILTVNLDSNQQEGMLFISEKNKRFESLTNRSFDLKNSFTEKLIEQSNPIITDYIKADLDKNLDDFQQEIYQMGFKESMAVRISYSGKTIGALYLISKERNFYNESQFDLIRGVAGQLGSTMSNILAFKKEQSRRQDLEREVSYLNEEIINTYNYKEIIGESENLQQILSRTRQVAQTDTTALIFGETGTGKELIARGIHHFSNRNKHPLIKVNCAALPPQLIESELFGHEKGSFTGAISKRLGKFELAKGSSIFLDEIGELPIDLQSKLLRVIQEKEFERIGGHEVIKTDVRIIAATNRDLEKEVEKGRFRADLYYRLNVFPIKLPPLRERKEDIPLLVAHFLIKLKKKVGKDISKVSSGSMNKMLEYDWPGNIRELEHVLERNAITSNSSIMEVELPSVSINLNGNKVSAAFLKPLNEIEAQHIIDVLKFTNGRIRGDGGAAELLKVKPTTLEAKMKKLGIVKKHIVQAI